MDRFFNANEKEFLLEELKQKAVLSGAKNAYEQFITECRAKKYPEGTLLEKHHIVPRHANGTDEPSNIISLSLKDHVFAHWIRWQVFDLVGDKRAYEYRVAQPDEIIALRQKNIMENVAKYKERGLFRYNSEYQSEMGKRGGSRGGSKNTPAQFSARQQVGLTYGRIGGVQNQSDILQQTIGEYTLWSYRGCKNVDNTYKALGAKGKTDCPNGATLTTFNVVMQPKEAFIDLAKALEIFAPGSINLKNVTTMYKLIREPAPNDSLSLAQGKGRSIYGWRFIKTLTRSEVEAGNIMDSSFTVYFEDAVFD